jgi:2-keto-4-pentenoate hydratase/2-oxohepta-3-ene-1,7-dioic acid hydratase in catechol pathway
MSSRRDFLLGTGMAIAALPVAGPGRADAPSAAAPVAAKGSPMTLPRQLTLLSIANGDGTETLGARTPRGVVDVRRAATHLGLAAPLTLEAMLREGRADELTRLVEAALRAPDGHAFLLEEAAIRHGRLFANPGKIVCVGLNYRRHAQEIGVAPPRVPPLFSKFNNALAAHGCTIELPPPSVAHKFDYETELLIVIGKAARQVAAADALQVVAGYCTANDFSARDLQLELPSAQWLLGKTLDRFAPIGPYFVSADQVADPNDLKIETRVNGELRQSWSTNDFIFNVQQMIAYISTFWTLEPGDIIFTGTPHGVILGYPKDKQVWLKAGDEIVSSVGHLGELRFRLG